MVLPVPSAEKLRVPVRVRTSDLLFDLFKKKGFEEAIVLQAGRGYNCRGYATSTGPGLSTKLPIIIERVEDGQKVLPLLDT